MTTGNGERILIVDDDPGFRRLLSTILTAEGYIADAVGTVRHAMEEARRVRFRLVLCDLRLPDADGLSLLRWLRDHSPDSAVIMMTAFGSVPTAVEAMKLGAVDYLGKPLSSPDELRLLVRRTLEQQRLQCEHSLLNDQMNATGCGELVAEDDTMLAVLRLIGKVAPTDATVLITGESGTGKELVARCIHRRSARAERVFVPVNCAALSSSLIESELFGHEKGAFTGAIALHQGRFERAHGGTIFLDEIGEMDAGLQAKLLRVLQERTLERLGGSRVIDIDVRVLAATNRDLKRMVAEGKFREDLYYRLHAFPLEVPPLRARPRDIGLLAQLFLRRASLRIGRSTPVLSDDALQMLSAYGWPGNVRELENLMERMAIISEGVVHARDLPLRSNSSLLDPVPVTVRDLQKQAILRALETHGGNRTKAARQLGISLRTMQYRLKEYGLTSTRDTMGDEGEPSNGSRTNGNKTNGQYMGAD